MLYDTKNNELPFVSPGIRGLLGHYPLWIRHVSSSHQLLSRGAKLAHGVCVEGLQVG